MDACTMCNGDGMGGAGGGSTQLTGKAPTPGRHQGEREVLTQTRRFTNNAPVFGIPMTIAQCLRAGQHTHTHGHPAVSPTPSQQCTNAKKTRE